ncbi:MAG: hypothetical protein HQ556_06990 [Candidatus Marinimicrobia bacterium]|nr:hypothetical protein [Candidatus Neomarinimicrobiota bacterium]
MKDINKILKSRTAEILLAENGIIHQNHFPESEVTLEDVKQELAIYPILSNNRKICVLIDLSNVKSVEKQARDYLASDATSEFVLATALVAPTMVSRVLGNFFLGLNKPPIPVKLFRSKEEGLEWLMQLISSQRGGQ